MFDNTRMDTVHTKSKIIAATNVSLQKNPVMQKMIKMCQASSLFNENNEYSEDDDKIKEEIDPGQP